MFISDIKRSRGLKTAFVYLLVTIFTALFGAVYEVFGRGVYSFFMLYAFAFPLLFGVLVFFIIGLCGDKRYPNPHAGNAYHAFIALMTVGSLMEGVLEIFGTTNRLTKWYWIAGVSFLFLSILFTFLNPGKMKSGE